MTLGQLTMTGSRTPPSWENPLRSRNPPVYSCRSAPLSPVSSVATWRSPVLLIHGDDDRNVRFSQTVDLARRLEARGVELEELVIPDDTHHFLKHANWLRVDAATAAWFERKLMGKGGR